MTSNSSSSKRLVRRRHLLFGMISIAMTLYLMFLWMMTTTTTTNHYHHVHSDDDSHPTTTKTQQQQLLPLFVKSDFVTQQQQQRNKKRNHKNNNSTFATDRNNKNSGTDTVATTTTAAATTATSSPTFVTVSTPPQTEPPAFLHYQLYQKHRPYNITFGPYTKCRLGITYNKRGKKPIERVALPTYLQEIMDVTTYIQTNLKILSVGDSVGIQVHQVLEEAIGGVWNDTRRTVYHNAWGDHESVSVLTVNETVVAAFRMTGLLLPSGKDRPPPNAGPNLKTGAGGWNPQHVQQLLQHEYTVAATTPTTTRRIERFDVMLFRIPHGWLTLDTITRHNLHEAVLLAHDLFGVNIVVLQTLFFNNNVRTMDDLDQFHQTNDMIRRFVKEWNHSTVTILLLDFGRWVDRLVHWNAQHMLQMDVVRDANYTLQRLGCFKKFPPSLAVACATLENRTDCTCVRNRLSIDGMHWCMESMGGRILAATACLIQCSLLSQRQYHQHHHHHQSCEQRCNDDFMSLKPASTIIESYHKNNHSSLTPLIVRG
ncbi:hypothetical protein IV203_006488 [Nitzschia inconspicua]|uniref:Uncharacterized protein n=1 Tax=Nitzschia inconspicua TaxID=303405 RepID=A0A9K3KA89_9STRA|nr:hypothetical protein IV203_006645 [Nitzschia inconspicua]KAG7340084.1 hypothetical protein IV203_006488 [Nitzschia inconspicua]